MDKKEDSLTEFFSESSTRDIHRLEEIIKKGVDLNEPILLTIGPFAGEKHPLHIAASLGDNRVVEVLLDHGAEVDIRDGNQNTPLHTAAEAGHHETVQLLIDRGAQVTARDWERNTPLHYTTCHKVAEVLIRNGAYACDKNSKNQSALHCVCASPGNMRELTELLIEHGAEVDDQDEDERSPLHLAAQHSSAEVLSVLVRKGANINLRDDAGWSPLHWAAKHHLNDTANLEFLLNRGALLGAQTILGDTALHVAAKHGITGALLVLLGKGVQLDVQNRLGSTALHEAAYYDECEVVNQLLAYGFSINVKNTAEKTPYEVTGKSSICQHFLATYINLSNLAGLHVCEDVEVDIPLSEEDREKADQELERIKATKLPEQLSLYKIFGQFRQPTYLLYEGVVEYVEQLFQTPGFLNQFPMYANILKGTFNRSKNSRYYLTRRATRSMMSDTRKECCQLTPDLVWDHLFKFLSLDDMTNIAHSEL